MQARHAERPVVAAACPHAVEMRADGDRLPRAGLPVRRNLERFSSDFMFQLSEDEFDSLRSQSVTSKRRGGRRYAPYAFTEQGVAMLSSVLRSKQAVQVNIAIMRAFVQLRELLASHTQLVEKLDELERKYDAQFRVVFDAIQELMAPERRPSRLLGFAPPGSNA